MTTRYYTATSLDGYIADPDNSLDWLMAVPDADNATGDVSEFLLGVGAMCLGATTYEWMVANEPPEVWHENYGDRPTWVFTHRELPELPGANVRFVASEVGPVHAEMVAAADGRDIWIIGGGDLAGQFADAGLLDEVVVGVAPVTLGGGAPLLPRRLLSDRLRLVEVAQLGQFAKLVYRVS
ncbi:dihydrofolate reductase family protein [Nocardia canadensis]|uniref:dihydrofolate reductase family protein n=1 Tax=Nocardia canadensis TaxID=3065238 RepID=UPI00292FC68E|nr:dihydrofolate reductase family protein [Nocardia canadensis]